MKTATNKQGTYQKTDICVFVFCRHIPSAWILGAVFGKIYFSANKKRFSKEDFPKKTILQVWQIFRAPCYIDESLAIFTQRNRLDKRIGSKIDFRKHIQWSREA